MRTFDELEKEGYEGSDASLQISLEEYGIIWKEEEKEYKFLFKFRPDLLRYDYGFFNKDLDLKKEFSWINDCDWASFFSYIGQTSDEWNKLPLPNKITDLYGYWGAENIFGGTYHEGCEIE